MKNRERMIVAALMLVLITATAVLLVVLCMLPPCWRVALVLPVSAVLFGYFARGHWLALAKKDQSKTAVLLIVLEVLGSMCAVHLIMSVTRETMGVSAAIALAVAGASAAGLLRLPPEGTRGKGLAALVKAVEAALYLVALVLLLQLMTGYAMPLSSWGRILAFALAPMIALCAAYAFAAKRRGVSRRRMLAHLGALALYTVLLVGFADICLPQGAARTVEATVTDLDRGRTGRGGRTYSADVLCEEEALSFRIGARTYAALDIGDAVIVERHPGALGVPFDTMSLFEETNETEGE